ncbi:MAG TPA: MFS transporter [Nocardioides sp.]|uniref:MFS transporter n=1 Tax=Nocardioides sp. TaxID=35761 RepID=UPI002F3F147F
MSSGALEPLKSSNFRLLAAGRTVSMAGNAIANIALGFAVLDLTGSLKSLSIVVASRSTANLLFAIIGGTAADRYDKKQVLLAACLGSATSQTALATVMISRIDNLLVLSALAGLSGLTAAFAFPASGALLPNTVEPEVLTQANAFVRIATNSTGLVATAAGGALVAILGPPACLYVDAASFVLAAACFGAIRLSRIDLADVEVQGTSYLQDLAQGWHYLRTSSWVWSIVVAAMVVNACSIASIAVIGPAIADAEFGRKAWGVILAMDALGLVIGGLVAIRIRNHLSLKLGTFCLVGEALLPFGLALNPTVWFLIVITLVGGVALEQMAVSWESSLQRYVPEKMLARIYAYDMFGSLMAVPIAQLIIGPMAESIGQERTLLLAGITICVSGLAPLTSRSLRDLPRLGAPFPQPS